MTRFDRTREKTAFARELRHPLSKPEVIMWARLRGAQIGVSFRKQHPVGPFFLDFYCASLSLAVEIDGAQHQSSRDYDTRRTASLNAKGIKVLRYATIDVLGNVEGVLYTLMNEIDKRRLANGRRLTNSFKY